MSDDLELVNGTLEGNIEAFEELIFKFENGIMRFIYNMVKNKEAAEDLTQENI